MPRGCGVVAIAKSEAGQSSRLALTEASKVVDSVVRAKVLKLACQSHLVAQAALSARSTGLG